jgi:SAM-dependent methyltransferase
MIDIQKREDLALLIDSMSLKKGLEIGVAGGAFSDFLLRNTKLELLYGVDAYSSDPEATGWATKKRDRAGDRLNHVYEDASKLLQTHGNRSRLIRGFSNDAKVLSTFEDEGLDFIYVDAAHRFWGVAQDLQNYWKKLRPGGLFAGHDYWHSYRCEVVYAVNGWVTENRQILNVTWADRPRKKYPPTWWLIKTDRDKGQYYQALKENKKRLMDSIEALRKRGVRVDPPDDYLG